LVENKYLIFKKNYKNKINIIFVLLYLFIIISQITEKLLLKNKILYYSNTINYKGERVLKYKLLENYLIKISDDFKSDKDRERKTFSKFYNLSEYSNESIIQSYLKEKLLKYISELKNTAITQIDSFYLSTNWNFGNSLIIMNNAIFLCEVIGCHKIILSKHNLKRRWLIKNPIYIEKLNITIMQDSRVDCKKSNTLCFYEHFWIIFEPKFVLPQVRTEFIKSEILGNLPEVNIDPDFIYVHIRGGDIFQHSPSKLYGQPPLCFYEKIIKNNEFKNIYIVSQDNSNVIINILLQKYKNIIHPKNNFEYDISLLCHAYNIVLSVSSFALSAIKFNDNLKNIWEYDMMKLTQKIIFLHHHIYKYPILYKIHTMRPSDYYNSKMFSWKRTPEQIKLMIEENCPYDFVLTKLNL